MGSPYGQQPAVSESTRVQAARDLAARNAEIAKATAESAESQIQQMDLRLSRLENAARATAGAGSSEVAALREQLAALQSELAALRADRSKLKAEIRDEIGGDIAKLLANQQKKAAASQPRQPAPQVSQTGYEHKVQSGQTLSAIAVAYGVSVEKIKKANNLKSDSIRVGQTLFIPD
jgi:LysM repeat protein